MRKTCPFCFHRVIPDPGTNGCPVEGCQFHERHIPFPDEILEGSEVFPIAIVGASSAGKTYYLTALLNEFQNNSFWDGDGGFWSMDFVHYASNKRQEGADNEFIRHWDTLFRKHRQLDPTNADEKQYRAPLLLSVKYSWSPKWAFREPYGKRNLVLAFHDVPGEFTTNAEARMALSERYGILGAAKGAIVLVEPTELPFVGQTLAQDGVLLPRGERGFALDAVKGLQAARFEKKPVAICLSKSDLLLGNPRLFPRDSHLFEYLHTVKDDVGMLRLDDVEEVSNQVKDSFDRFNAGEFRPLLEKSFKYSSFFALSALGMNCVNPKTGELTRTPQPVRIIDPILWILWQWGKIGGSRPA